MDLDCDAVRSWREILATLSDDVFEIMETSIAVATQYRPHDFLRRKDMIAERLLGNPSGFVGDNFTTEASSAPYSSETVQGPRRLVLRLRLPVKQRREDENAAERPSKLCGGKAEDSVASGERKVVVGSKTVDAEKEKNALRVKKDATKGKRRRVKENSRRPR